jgi:hypothetical protein
MAGKSFTNPDSGTKWHCTNAVKQENTPLCQFDGGRDKNSKKRLLGHIFTHNTTHKAGFPLSSFTAAFWGALTSSCRCRLVAGAFVGYLPTPHWVRGPSSKHFFGFAASFFDLNGRVSVDFFYHNALSGACIELAVPFGCQSTH